MTMQEFVDRFVARMLAVAGPTFDDGSSIQQYAKDTAPSYFDEYVNDPLETPEVCADSDMSYWGE
ncbi:hypothetical protein V9K92_10255 [Phyllobacterium sp. CCNWLW109]|uniref:hypothetical protein n=1 Tax=Phyllobacterium sp. CCNWLW109 TaxID=3127479 RepID=UPI003076D249